MYKEYREKELIYNWDKLIKKDREEVEKVQEEWRVVEEFNETVRREGLRKRHEVIREIIESLEEEGVTVRKSDGSYYAWFEKNISKTVNRKYVKELPEPPRARFGKQEINGIVVRNNASPLEILDLYASIKIEYEYEKKKQDKNNKLLQESIKYALNRGIDIAEVDTVGIIEFVNDYATETYREDNLQEGTEIYLKNECENCNTYVVGNRRCSCGNRRISMVVDGNLLDGYSHYPEAF